MIGQKYLKKYVQTLIEEDNFPQFSIFVGPKGSGKKTFMREYFDGIYLKWGIKHLLSLTQTICQMPQRTHY